MKTLAEFDWSFDAKMPKTKIVELASARFVDTHSGVLLIGPPGVRSLLKSDLRLIEEVVQ